MIVVADYYQLGKFNGVEFDKDQKKLIRKGAKITEEYFEMVNINWPDRGKMYVRDVAATEQYYIDSAKDVARREEKEAKKEALANSVFAEFVEVEKPRRGRKPNTKK